MRIISLVTGALLSASAVASAQPWNHDRYGDRDRDRDHDRDRDRDRDYRIDRNQWTTLAEGVRITGQGDVRIDLGGARVRSIELQAVHGWSNVTMIGIQYSDGGHGVLKFNRDLSAEHSPNLRFDLGPEAMRGVNAIVVYGRGRGEFRVIGG